MFSQLRPLLVVFTCLTLITGVVYPLAVTAVAQGLFPHATNGSVVAGGGSELIGQPFDAPHYFWGRPSATSPVPYNAAASTGSNLGPTNPDLAKVIGDRVQAIRQAHPEQSGPVPADLATTSASGLDPHISPEAAEYQVIRIASARKASADEIRRLVSAHTRDRTFGVLGEPRVNVLLLNRELDARFPLLQARAR